MKKAPEELARPLLERHNSGELSIEQLVNEYYEAVNTRPRLEKVIDELRNVLASGKHHLDAWGQIYQASHGDDMELIELAFQYFMLTAGAHIQMATLQAAKLTEDNADSVNLHYFFNVLLNEGKKNFPDNWEEVKGSVESDRVQILGLQSIVNKIKAERDKRLAHHDRNIINSRTDEVARVEASELDKLFHAIQTMLDKYYTYYYGSEPGKIVITEDLVAYWGTEELDDLFHLARKALDDESMEDVSDHIKQVRAHRKTRQSVEKELKLRTEAVA